MSPHAPEAALSSGQKNLQGPSLMAPTPALSPPHCPSPEQQPQPHDWGLVAADSRLSQRPQVEPTTDAEAQALPPHITSCPSPAQQAPKTDWGMAMAASELPLDTTQGARNPQIPIQFSSDAVSPKLEREEQQTKASELPLPAPAQSCSSLERQCRWLEPGLIATASEAQQSEQEEPSSDTLFPTPAVLSPTGPSPAQQPSSLASGVPQHEEAEHKIDAELLQACGTSATDTAAADEMSETHALPAEPLPTPRFPRRPRTPQSSVCGTRRSPRLEARRAVSEWAGKSVVGTEVGSSKTAASRSRSCARPRRTNVAAKSRKGPPRQLTSSADVMEAVCTVCKKGHASDANDIGLCDRCDRGFHQLCHTPVVETFGREDEQWFCAECAEDLAVSRGLRFRAGDFAWAPSAAAAGTQEAATQAPVWWPAHVLSVDFSSLTDETPYRVALFSGDKSPEGQRANYESPIWLREDQILAWTEGLVLDEVVEPERCHAVLHAAQAGAIPIAEKRSPGASPVPPPAPVTRESQQKRKPVPVTVPKARRWRLVDEAAAEPPIQAPRNQRGADKRTLKRQRSVTPQQLQPTGHTKQARPRPHKAAPRSTQPQTTAPVTPPRARVAGQAKRKASESNIPPPSRQATSEFVEISPSPEQALPSPSKLPRSAMQNAVETPQNSPAKRPQRSSEFRALPPPSRALVHSLAPPVVGKRGSRSVPKAKRSSVPKPKRCGAKFSGTPTRAQADAGFGTESRDPPPMPGILRRRLTSKTSVATAAVQ